MTDVPQTHPRSRFGVSLPPTPLLPLAPKCISKTSISLSKVQFGSYDQNQLAARLENLHRNLLSLSRSENWFPSAHLHDEGGPSLPEDQSACICSWTRSVRQNHESMAKATSVQQHQQTSSLRTQALVHPTLSLMAKGTRWFPRPIRASGYEPALVRAWAAQNILHRPDGRLRRRHQSARPEDFPGSL